MSNLIYQSAEWGKVEFLPNGFNDSAIIAAGKEEYASKYTKQLVGSRALRMPIAEGKLFPPAMRAIIRYAYLHTLGAQGKTVNNGGALATLASDKGYDSYLAQFNNTKDNTSDMSESAGITLVKYDSNGNVMAGTIYDNTGTDTVPYTLYDKKGAYTASKDGAAIIFALLGEALKDSEFSDAYSQFRILYEVYLNNMTNCDMKPMYEQLGIMCDNLYRRITNPDACGSMAIKLELKSRTTNNIIDAHIRAGYDITSMYVGVFTSNIIKPTANTMVSNKPNFSTRRGEYAMSKRELNPAEELMVPKMDDWYIIPQSVETVAEHIQKSTDWAVPFRNFIFRGEAGTGKTEAVKAIAYLLGLPYTFITCSANTEIYDFLVQVLPDVTDSEGNEVTAKELLNKYPSYFDISTDSVGSYKKITGKMKNDATEDDCFAALLSDIASKMKSNGQRFKYVDSPLVNAVRYGYVCEIQEPTVIANPGVLVGLNALFDRTATLQLMTGETIKRHPETVIVMTTNNDYEGCRNINQSVLSRMGLAVDMHLPNDRQIYERVKAVTGFSNDDTLLKMIAVARAMQSELYKLGVSDGNIGIRELIMWVQSTMITRNVYLSAIYTVISLGTSDSDAQEKLTSILASQFSENE